MLKKMEDREREIDRETEIERQGEIEGEREEGSVLQDCNHLGEKGFAPRISYCYYFFPTFSVLSPTVPHLYLCVMIMHTPHLSINLSLSSLRSSSPPFSPLTLVTTSATIPCFIFVFWCKTYSRTSWKLIGPF